MAVLTLNGIPVTIRYRKVMYGFELRQDLGVKLDQLLLETGGALKPDQPIPADDTRIRLNGLGNLITRPVVVPEVPDSQVVMDAETLYARECGAKNRCWSSLSEADKNAYRLKALAKGVGVTPEIQEQIAQVIYAKAFGPDYCPWGRTTVDCQAEAHKAARKWLLL